MCPRGFFILGLCWLCGWAFSPLSAPRAGSALQMRREQYREVKGLSRVTQLDMGSSGVAPHPDPICRAPRLPGDHRSGCSLTPSLSHFCRGLGVSLVPLWPETKDICPENHAPHWDRSSGRAGMKTTLWPGHGPLCGILGSKLVLLRPSPWAMPPLLVLVRLRLFFLASPMLVPCGVRVASQDVAGHPCVPSHAHLGPPILTGVWGLPPGPWVS